MIRWELRLGGLIPFLRHIHLSLLGLEFSSTLAIFIIMASWIVYDSKSVGHRIFVK